MGDRITRRLRIAALMLACVLPGACRSPLPPEDTGLAPLPEGVECRSLLGEELRPPPLPAELRQTREKLLADACRRLEERPDDLDALIWVGRRTAYLGRYREAVAVYTRGLARWPHEPRLLRHRGHRYITLRRFDLATRDLRAASRLVAGRPDRVEEDGLPNARGIPTSTLQSNVWYHLGLALYLQGRLDEALTAYEQCLKVSKNPDMLCATSHWLSMTLRRLHRVRAAAALLEPITPDMDVIENHGYHRLLLLKKGLLSEQEVAGRDADGIQSATVGYGLARWHLSNGRTDRGLDLLERIVRGAQWAAFGHIAAEAELARLQR